MMLKSFQRLSEHPARAGEIDPDKAFSVAAEIDPGVKENLAIVLKVIRKSPAVIRDVGTIHPAKVRSIGRHRLYNAYVIAYIILRKRPVSP